jgi:hypothetical protein
MLREVKKIQGNFSITLKNHTKTEALNQLVYSH